MMETGLETVGLIVTHRKPSGAPVYISQESRASMRIVRFDAVRESRHQIQNPDDVLSANEEWQLLPTCRYCRGVHVKETLFLEIYPGA
jgi:hypothetical protein